MRVEGGDKNQRRKRLSDTSHIKWYRDKLRDEQERTEYYLSRELARVYTGYDPYDDWDELPDWGDWHT